MGVFGAHALAGSRAEIVSLKPGSAEKVESWCGDLVQEYSGEIWDGVQAGMSIIKGGHQRLRDLVGVIPLTYVYTHL